MDLFRFLDLTGMNIIQNFVAFKAIQFTNYGKTVM